MAEIKRLGYTWHLRQIMARHNLWKSTQLRPLLRERGINLSESQVYRLVTGTPERLSIRVLIALCDIFDCTPNDLIEGHVEMRAAQTAQAPRGDDLGTPQPAIARRITLVTENDGPAEET